MSSTAPARSYHEEAVKDWNSYVNEHRAHDSTVEKSVQGFFRADSYENFEERGHVNFSSEPSSHDSHNSSDSGGCSIM